MLRILGVLTAIGLLGSVTTADELDKLYKEKVNCDRDVAHDPDAKLKEPGLLSFEKMGLCRERTSSTAEMPWWGPGCATLVACGMRLEWDDKLKIWQPYRNNR
jgi:hypothetical protein